MFAATVIFISRPIFKAFNSFNIFINEENFYNFMSSIFLTISVSAGLKLSLVTISADLTVILIHQKYQLII